MAEINWAVVGGMVASGVFMALISALVGMRPKLENPAWWGLYIVWIAVVVRGDLPSPFLTLFLASAITGVVHGTILAVLIDPYIRNNPWHAEQMQGERGKLRLQFVAMGSVVGTIFGLVVGGVGSGLCRL